MGLGDLGNVVLIVFIFMLLHLFLSLSIGIAEIKRNWNKYKCNPGVMPFAAVFGHDPKKNLNECIKLTQVNFMSAFLEPIYGSLNAFAKTGMIFTSIFEDIKFFGMDQQIANIDLGKAIKSRAIGAMNSLNVMFLNVKDTFGQLSSSIRVIYYILEGSIRTVKVADRNLPGTLIGILGG